MNLPLVIDADVARVITVPDATPDPASSVGREPGTSIAGNTGHGAATGDITVCESVGIGIGNVALALNVHSRLPS